MINTRGARIMYKLIVLILIVMSSGVVQAGNVNNTRLISMHLDVDASMPRDAMDRAVNLVNAELVDIQITYSYTEIDYDVVRDKHEFLHWFSSKEAGIFKVSHDRAWSSFAGAARLQGRDYGKMYVNSNQFDTLDIDSQAAVIAHEIVHLLGLGHASLTDTNSLMSAYSIVHNLSTDDKEALRRLYDVTNSLGYGSIRLNNPDKDVVTIIKKKKGIVVATTNEYVKLTVGKYIIKIGDEYIRKGRKKKIKIFKVLTNEEMCVL